MHENFKFKDSDGIEYEVIFRKPNKKHYGDNCDGYCTGSGRIIINPYRTNKTQLNTAIHEFAHAFFWDKKEYEVAKFANELTKFLYSYSQWRKKKD